MDALQALSKFEKLVANNNRHTLQQFQKASEKYRDNFRHVLCDRFGEDFMAQVDSLRRKPRQLDMKVISQTTTEDNETKKTPDAVQAPPRSPVRRSPIRANSSRPNTPHGPSSGASSKYVKGPIIGTGAFGKVYRALDTETGKIVAMKCVEFDNNDPNVKDKLVNLQREIQVLKTVNHRNIVTYINTEVHNSTLSIFMEYVSGGTVAQALEHFGKFPENVTARYARHVLEGLHYLHSAGIVHRDIKGANVLLTVDGQAKLADFGAANFSDKHKQLESLKGTPVWMAPEMVSEKGHNWHVDIWSFGCTVMEMLTGFHPFHYLGNQLTILNHIMDDTCDIKLPPSGISETARDLVQTCLRRQPDARPSAETLLKHPFLALGYQADSPTLASLANIPRTILDLGLAGIGKPIGDLGPGLATKPSLEPLGRAPSYSTDGRPPLFRAVSDNESRSPLHAVAPEPELMDSCPLQIEPSSPSNSKTVRSLLNLRNIKYSHDLTARP